MADVDENHIERDIIPFLLPSSRSDLRAIAVRYFVGLTGTEQGRLFIGRKPNYVNLMSDLIDDEVNEIAKDVSLAMINLAADLEVVVLLSDTKLVQHLLKSAFYESVIDGRVAAMALSNMSRKDRSARIIAETMARESDVDLSINRLVDVLCKDDTHRLEHLASLLANLTQILDNRRLILNKDRCLMQRLLPFVNCSQSLCKRTGIVATIRNCCFETGFREWLLSDQIDILPRLLLPLAGPEEFDDDDMEKLPIDLQYLEPDKQREPQADIRCMLVECVNQLCALKTCRQTVKDKNAYVILRELHKWETVPSNIMAIENVIHVLISDEPEPGMENLNEIDIPEHISAKLKAETEKQEQELNGS